MGFDCNYKGVTLQICYHGRTCRGNTATLQAMSGGPMNQLGDWMRQPGRGILRPAGSC